MYLMLTLPSNIIVMTEMFQSWKVFTSFENTTPAHMSSHLIKTSRGLVLPFHVFTQHSNTVTWLILFHSNTVTWLILFHSNTVTWLILFHSNTVTWLILFHSTLSHGILFPVSSGRVLIVTVTSPADLSTNMCC